MRKLHIKTVLGVGFCLFGSVGKQQPWSLLKNRVYVNTVILNLINYVYCRLLKTAFKHI